MQQPIYNAASNQYQKTNDTYVYPTDGAVLVVPAIHRLNKGSAAAMTLAAPTVGQEGTELTITAGTNFPHVVTTTLTGSRTTLTFTAPGATVNLRAVAQKWDPLGTPTAIPAGATSRRGEDEEDDDERATRGTKKRTTER